MAADRLEVPLVPLDRDDAALVRSWAVTTALTYLGPVPSDTDIAWRRERTLDHRITVGVDDGQVDLDWSIDGEMIRLVWTERGAGCEVIDAPSSGFGQRMIAMSVRSDLNGTIERDWRPDGLTATLTFPAAG